MTLSIGILGLGAIGTIMAAHWREHSLFAVGRPHIPPTRHLQTGESVLARWPDFPPSQDFTLPVWTGESLDWLVVTTKARDTLNAIQQIQDHLPLVKRLLLIQNGMGQQQQLQQWLTAEGLACELWQAIATDGGYLSSQGDNSRSYVYAGAGEVMIGRWQADPDNHVPVGQLPPHLTVVSDIHRRQYMKLAVNCVINPLTALYSCLNGELVTHPAYLQQLLRLSEEVLQLGQQLNWDLPTELPELIQQVATATGANRSSTLQDVLAGRPTELDYILGYALNCARQAAIDLPALSSVARQLELAASSPLPQADG
ncbi:ketopantoate reductase family protein [Oceanobacter mangrovi]|uniref:ketopantoate reductase family protein n=1 Tax=Oceanobacter mangrovi TaxID=2862510 RepID=UPI001C8DB165|nr:2-dehydropantoate 2-reductase [Oceanobacter mangrovi]